MILLEKVSDFVGGSLYSMAFHDSLSSFMKQILIEWETEEGMLLFLFCECRDTPINTRSMTGLVNYRSKTLNTFDFVVRLVPQYECSRKQFRSVFYNHFGFLFVLWISQISIIIARETSGVSPLQPHLWKRNPIEIT